MNTFTNSVFKNLYGETLLTSLFFSHENVKSLQNLLKREVYKSIQLVIDDQSETELLVIMRSVFLSDSRHPTLITPQHTESQKKVLYLQYTQEVERLNTIVVQQAAPIIVTYVKQFLAYEQEIRSGLRVMDKPVATSIKGERNLEMTLRN